MSTSKKQIATCAPKTAVAYARYSSAQQRDVSIEQQLRDIRVYAEREGYTIIYEYADHAKSGFKNVERRQEFQAMLRAASTGSFDTVIAWKVDRFGRNRRESAIYKGQLADLGVSVLYAMEPIPDGAAGVLTEGMLEALAEWYSRNISENTKRGQHDNAIKCLTNGHTAYGYEKGPDNHFAVYEPEAAVVRRIFTYYSEGYSIESIITMLNKEGIKTNKGREFQRSTLYSILKNDVYIGVYHYAGVSVPGGVPAIISRELWDACQEQRKKTHKHAERVPDRYLLSGKCVCGYCNSKMYGAYGTSKAGKKLFYYACRGRRRKRCSEKSYIRRDDVETAVMDFLLNNVLSGEMLDRFIDMVADVLNCQNETSPLKQLENEYNDTIRRINNINRAISEGVWTQSTVDMLRSLTAQSEELAQKIAYHNMTENKIISRDRISFYMHKIIDGKRDDPDFLKTLVGVLVNTIIIYKDYLTVVINAAENVSQVPPDKVPPLEQLQEASVFDQCSVWGPKVGTVEPYPVIIFKIAI